MKEDRPYILEDAIKEERQRIREQVQRVQSIRHSLARVPRPQMLAGRLKVKHNTQ